MYQVVCVLGSFYPQLHTKRAGKLFGQFILESHGFAPVIEIRSRAVEGQHHQFSTVFHLRQIVVCHFIALRLLAACHHADAGEEQEPD